MGPQWGLFRVFFQGVQLFTCPSALPPPPPPLFLVCPITVRSLHNPAISIIISLIFAEFTMGKVKAQPLSYLLALSHRTVLSCGHLAHGFSLISRNQVIFCSPITIMYWGKTNRYSSIHPSIMQLHIKHRAVVTLVAVPLIRAPGSPCKFISRCAPDVLPRNDTPFLR